MTNRLLPNARPQTPTKSRFGRAAVIALLVTHGVGATLLSPAYAHAEQAVARLADGRWVLAEIRGAGRFPHHPADIFKFDGKGMSGRIGCNWLSASAALVEGVVTYADAKQTTMGCRIKNDPFESRRIDAVGAALDGAHVERATSTQAELVSLDGKTTLVFHRLKH